MHASVIYVIVRKLGGLFSLNKCIEERVNFKTLSGRFTKTAVYYVSCSFSASYYIIIYMMVPSSQSSSAGVIHFLSLECKLFTLHNLYMIIYNKHTADTNKTEIIIKFPHTVRKE